MEFLDPLQNHISYVMFKNNSTQYLLQHAWRKNEYFYEYECKDTYIENVVNFSFKYFQSVTDSSLSLKTY